MGKNHQEFGGAGDLVGAFNTIEEARDEIEVVKKATITEYHLDEEQQNEFWENYWSQIFSCQTLECIEVNGHCYVRQGEFAMI